MDFIDLKKQLSIIRKPLEERFQTILNHGKYIMGPEVAELERKLSEFVNVRNAISCSSGTDALLIPLMAKGVGPGDAIITTPFTYIATGEVISLLGATPVFVDIYAKTFNIDPAQISNGVEEALKKGLYALAREGKIKQFTGISDPYEEPKNAEIVINSSDKSPEKLVEEIYDKIIEMGYIVRVK